VDQNGLLEGGLRVLALDIGGSRTKWAVFQGGEMVESGAFPTPQDPDALLRSVRGKEAHRIAVAFAGFAHEGTVAFSPNLPEYQGVRLVDLISRETGARVILENDANCFVLGEALRGAGRGAICVLGLTLGTGIGGGLVIDGRLYRGAGFALEPGHTIVDPDGPPCACGSRGCLESLIGERAFCARFGYPSARKAAEAKDEKAWDFYGHWLGIALANFINILDPDAVVLGGGVAGAIGLFWSSMMAAVESGTVQWKMRKTRLVRSELGEHAALWGGYILAENPGH
jgi:glucokinase